MATLRILSAGAAQAVTERMIDQFKRETRNDVLAQFGAVGAMKAKVTAGEPVDVIILTGAMIDELVESGFVERGSRFDLGTVGTGVAVRAGAVVPTLTTADTLRESLRRAARIVCPDPQIATAGKIVMKMLERLDIANEVQKRLQFFPNGYAAMNWLATSNESAIGITQITEILPNNDVAYAGPLPEEFQMKAVYAAAIAHRSDHPELARDLIRRFAAPSSRALLVKAGYELAP